MKFEDYNYVVPTWMLTPIFNNDLMGLQNSEVRLYHSFMNSLPGDGHFGCPDDVDSEAYFSHSNDVDHLAGNVIPLTFHKIV